MIMNNLIHIHKDAKIGKNVVIEPFTTIHGDIEIGDGTWIASNVTIMDGSRIGKNCKIFPGAVIGAIPQDLKYQGEKTVAIIGDNTTIRECVTVNKGTASRGKTSIGNNCLLMAYVHVGHDCILKNNIIISNSTNVAGEVEIGDFAVISAAVQIHQFVKIGAHVMISGGTLVRKDVPPFVKAAREPISYVGINSIGLRRRGFDNGTISNIQNIYRILYNSNSNTSVAINKIEEEVPEIKERNYIIDFINNATRGIIKG